MQAVKTEKLRKYDLLANELSMIGKCKMNIISCVLTCDVIAKRHHDEYRKELKATDRIETYIQSKILHKTLESVSLEFKEGCKNKAADMEKVVR